MKYTGNSGYRHDNLPVTGVLVSNLGTPDQPTTSAVRRYLAEFLSDPRVIETSKWLWLPILHGIILRTRPRRSAEAYRKIWTEAGSPLLTITRQQAAAIQQQLDRLFTGPVRVEAAMRYGNPSIPSALERLRQANARRLLVLPLYPQYSATTTASTFDAVAQTLSRWRWLPDLRLISHYHDQPPYIEALAESVRQFWIKHDSPERLLFSFHGLPKRYFLAGDPYFCECHKTARLLASELGLDDGAWAIAFQSRFGPAEWLPPYTDKLLQQWGREGVKRVHVMCPGFSADCLETLEEIQLQNREFFLGAGGSEFAYIPALNDDAMHIEALCDLIVGHCQGWPETDPGFDRQQLESELQAAGERAAAVAGDTGMDPAG